MCPDMIFNSIENIRAAGFEGFVTTTSLYENSCASVPLSQGVYFIIQKNNKVPSFLEIGSGGHFKGKDPNVPISKLQDNWVEGAVVLYIGKATDLNKRLRQYMSFGHGSNVGHWGGRYIWQLSYSSDLLVCWKETQEDPREVEYRMIQEFSRQFHMRPFANLKD